MAREFHNKLRNGELFLKHLNNILDPAVLDWLNVLKDASKTYIFSGIIRDYFLDRKVMPRDLDLVIGSSCSTCIEEIAEKYPHRRNSYGGYKFFIDKTTIDVWLLDNTWALTNNKLQEKFLFRDLELVGSSFFNFSSVLFSLSDCSFQYNRNFIDFLDSHTIDIVLEENPLPQLCVVNILYYKRKLMCSVSERIKEYYLRNFPCFSEEDYDAIQVKHFGQVECSYELLKGYYTQFEKEAVHQ